MENGFYCKKPGCRGRLTVIPEIEQEGKIPPYLLGDYPPKYANDEDLNWLECEDCHAVYWQVANLYERAFECPQCQVIVKNDLGYLGCTVVVWCPVCGTMCMISPDGIRFPTVREKNRCLIQTPW